MSYSLQDRLLKQSPLSDPQQAIASYSGAVLASPDRASACADLGVALRVAGHLSAAIALYRRAVALDPRSAVALSNLGGALRASGDLNWAVAHLQRAVEIAPEFSAGHFNLGLALEDAGRLEEALTAYDRVLALDPARTDARIQKAFTLLRLGRLEEGFAQYECRLQSEPMLKRNFTQPAWNGQPFPGKTILLYAEQGRGDTFQFIRYAPLVKALGTEVIVECQPETAAVVATVPGVDKVVSRGQALPHFDCHASLMSLPFLLRTTLETIPGAVPYLQVPPGAAGGVNVPPSSLIKVGIAWSSGHEDVGAHERSIALEHFLRLLEIPQVALYSLQVGPAVCDLARLGVQHLIPDLGSRFKDFSHTADAISQLDLVVSVDTAIVHLAGAMAKPVFVFLPYASEWRWLRHRTDSPWYPTARLYRQEKPMSWDDAFNRAAADLARFRPFATGGCSRAAVWAG